MKEQREDARMKIPTEPIQRVQTSCELLPSR